MTLASDMIEIVEVGPRDGLQNESVVLSTAQKLSLIDHLIASGLKRIEAVSFAHPKLVPQMADAEAVMAGVPRSQEISYIGLVMNTKGWQRAVDAGVDEVNMPLFTTDTFNTRNQGATTLESIAALSEIATEAKTLDMHVTATIGTAWGCPFEGEVTLDRLMSVVEGVVEVGVSEIALADTIGVADPWSVAQRIEAVKTLTDNIPLRVHFHDTRNTGIANVYAAIQSGVTVIDSSVGGIGGCPFAPAATGNIATDDLVYMLNRAGFSHGVSLSELIGTSAEVSEALGKEVPAMLPKAGDFP